MDKYGDISWYKIIFLDANFHFHFHFFCSTTTTTTFLGWIVVGFCCFCWANIIEIRAIYDEDMEMMKIKFFYIFFIHIYIY